MTRSERASPIILPSEITPQEIAMDRRSFLAKAAAGAAAGSALMAFASRQAWAAAPAPIPAAIRNAALSVKDHPTTLKDATGYNNFYEFGTDKADPAAHAHTLKTHPWSVKISGEVAKPLTLDIDDLAKLAPMEERLYRLRCVEGWSMAIPWMGFSLSALIAKAKPTASAKFIEFISLADPAQMPGVRSSVLQWPYTEGLRMDEAMHPLAMLVFGMYGASLAPQNGAPLRLAVPWKYGFKSAKSIVEIRFVKDMPRTSWNVSAPSEYGFYSNVNPLVDHPRWSQASERRVGEDGFFSRKRKTEMFNGYESQVASLYVGMDLKKFF